MSRRLAPAVWGCLLAAAVGAVLVGLAGDGGGVIVVLPLAGVAFGGVLLLQRPSARHALPDTGWSSGDRVLIVAPQARPAASSWRIARALGRVEARELLGSGAYGIGLGFCALLLLLFGIVWAPENTDPWFDVAPMAPWFCLPLVGMTVVGAHRAVTRARRDGVDELLDTCPASEVTRTYGFLLSAVTPLVTLVVFLATYAVLLAVRDPFLYGSLGARDWADVTAAVLLGVGGVALGVALGRWLRFSLVPIVAVVAVGLFGVRLSEVGGHDWNPYSTLAMAPTVEWESPVFQARPAGWHLLWVVGLSALVGLVAVAKHRRDRVVQGLVVLTATVVVIAGIGATRPMPASSAARISEAIVDPAAVQECSAIGAVSVCLFPIHRPVLPRLLDDLAAIAEVLPAAAGEWTVRQRYDGDHADLPPEVRRRVDEDDLRVPPGEVSIEFGEDDDPLRTASYQLALGVVGLPEEAGPDLLPEVAAGQARGVVALWLATRGAGASEVQRLTNAAHPGSLDAFERGVLEVGDCSVPSVVWSRQDLQAVRSLLTVPPMAVASLLDAGWARWTSPRTSTDELMDALGLPSVGPFDEVVARAGNPC